jgi:vacuolar-type H+-ATPase subunit F/Vma7
MARIEFLGDETSAAGFHLAGATVTTARPDTVQAALARAREQGDLVLVTAEYAGWLPEPVLDEALARAIPPVVIIPDARGDTAPPDLRGQVRQTLGIGP